MAKYTDKEMDRIISAGKKSYASMSNKGQPGGMSSVPSQGKRDAFVNLQRQKFFGDRDIPEERVLRRTRQEGGVRQFKDALIRNDRVVKGTRPDGTTYTVMNPNTGEPVYLTDVPGGRSVGDVSRDLAYRFGPTPREVAGDIGYGIRSIGSALGQKVAAGEFGFMGLAKSLYEQFTNSAAKAKDALVKGVNKLSDIDLEVLKKKDTGEYKFLSKKAEIQEVENLEKTQMTAFDQANLIRANMERVSTPLTEADTAQSFKVQPEDQVNLQDIYMQGTKRYEPISVSGTQPMYAGGLESLLPKPIQNLQQRVSSLGETPIGTFGMENIRSGKPAFTYEKDIFGGQLGVKADPFRDQYGFEFSRAFKDGGSVDDKLDNMQKKTNNIYGTGILSAR
jgi:hypothetical protein